MGCLCSSRMQPPKRTFSLRGPAGSSSTRAAAADGATDDDDESALSRAAADGALRFRDFALGMVVRVVVERGRRKGVRRSEAAAAPPLPARGALAAVRT